MNSIFSINSKAYASELLEDIEEYTTCIARNVFHKFKSSATQ